MKRRMISWIAAVFLATPAAGHDLWVDRGEEGFTIHEGHRGGDDHGGAPSKAVDPGLLLRASCHGEDGTLQTLDATAAWPLFPGGGCVAFTALLSSGYRTKTASGTKSTPKDETAGALQSRLFFEGVKYLERWIPAFAAPLTDDLEIVPLHDPFAAKPGGKLHLQIVREGKPVEGAVVLVDGKARGETDMEGRINVKLRSAGFQSIVASRREPGDGVKTDEIVRTTTLNFVLEEHPR